MDRVFTSGLILAGMLVVVRRRPDWAALRKENTWLFAIHLFALFSLVWSDYPFVSLKRYIRFTGSVVMGLVILSEVDSRQALESVLRKMVFVLIPLSLVLIKYVPNLGVAYGRWSGGRMWVGVADQKNSFGILCFIASFYLFWRLLRTWKTANGSSLRAIFGADCLIFVMALYLLKGAPNAYSATSISVFVLGVAALLGLSWLRVRGRHLGVAVTVGFSVALFVYGLGAPFGLCSVGSSIIQLLGRDATFTDRDEIWAALVPVALKHPLLGHGYGGFWVRTAEFEVNEAHNGYLNVALELGIVGILLLFGFIVSSCIKAHAASRNDFWHGSFAYCLLLMIVLHNTSEASLLRTSDLLWTLLVFVSLLMPVISRAEPPASVGEEASAIDDVREDECDVKDSGGQLCIISSR